MAPQFRLWPLVVVFSLALSSYTVNLILTRLEGYLSVCVWDKTRKKKNGAHLTRRRTNAKRYGST
jgi:hypothetical protein